MNLNVVTCVAICFISLAFQAVGFAGQEDAIKLVTENIMKVCDKPENAGKYWDIKVKGNGEAALRLKLFDLCG